MIYIVNALKSYTEYDTYLNESILIFSIRVASDNFIWSMWITMGGSAISFNVILLYLKTKIYTVQRNFHFYMALSDGHIHP